MENITITFENGSKKEYQKGIKLKEIIKDIKNDYPFEIISAKFKNQLIGHEDAIMKSGKLELFDITTPQGNKIYERGVHYENNAKTLCTGTVYVHGTFLRACDAGGCRGGSQQ